MSLITNELSLQDPPGTEDKKYSRKTTTLAIIAVLGATVVWGSQYLLIKDALLVVPLFLFQGMRHLIAFLGFFPWWKKFKQMNKQIFLASLYNAIAFYFLILFVSWGLKYTDSSEGAFMATMYVIFTPFVGFAMLKTKITALKMLGVVLAVIGMGFMLLGNAGLGSISFIGDILVLIGAFFNAIEIVLLEKYTKEIDTMLFVLTQMGLIAAMLLGTSFAFQETVDWGSIGAGVWISWIYLGIVAGTITLLIQANAQRMIDETRAALLYSLEPVFATFFGVITGATPLTIMFIAGASLIMAGILLSSMKLNHRKKVESGTGEIMV